MCWRGEIIAMSLMYGIAIISQIIVLMISKWSIAVVVMKSYLCC